MDELGWNEYDRFTVSIRGLFDDIVKLIIDVVRPFNWIFDDLRFDCTATAPIIRPA